MPQNWSIDLIQKAWNLAAELHQGQQYSGPQEGQHFEYLKHIGGVTFEMLNALQFDPDLDAQIAIPCAILHDTIEDTAVDFVQMEVLFGKTIAEGVAALSKDSNLPDKAARMRDSLDRIRKQPKSVWAVKLADRIVNLDPPPYHWKPAKIQAYQKEAQIILEQLGAGSPYLADRLAKKILAYREFIILE